LLDHTILSVVTTLSKGKRGGVPDRDHEHERLFTRARVIEGRVTHVPSATTVYTVHSLPAQSTDSNVGAFPTDPLLRRIHETLLKA